MNNVDRVEENNNRLFSRKQSDLLLEPVFDPRPTGTRGGMMPVISTKKEAEVQFRNYANYTTSSFAPATKTAPFRRFAENINEESELRNQIFALQRSEKGAYVPQSFSDLYIVTVPEKGLSQEEQKNLHYGLFEEQSFKHFDPGSKYDTQKLFNNDTKQALKNSK